MKNFLRKVRDECAGARAKPTLAHGSLPFSHMNQCHVIHASHPPNSDLHEVCTTTMHVTLLLPLFYGLDIIVYSSSITVVSVETQSEKIVCFLR